MVIVWADLALKYEELKLWSNCYSGEATSLDWIAKTINGTADEFVHAKVLKYGIGTHPGPRAFLTLSSTKISFKADLDMEKVFIRAYLAGVPQGKQKVSGVIITYTDRSNEFSKITLPLEWKKSKGKGAAIYRAKIKEIIPFEHLKELVSVDDPTTFFLLSISPNDGTKPWKVATKTSFPKSPPSIDPESEKDPTFCKGALGNNSAVKEFLKTEILPDVKDKITEKTKKIKIYHEIIIENIDIPDDPNLSFAEKRRLAKKTGKLLRRVNIDGDEVQKEFPFMA